MLLYYYNTINTMAYTRINKARYLQAYELRQTGLTFEEIGNTMKISKSRVRQMVVIYAALLKRRKILSRNA